MDWNAKKEEQAKGRIDDDKTKRGAPPHGVRPHLSAPFIQGILPFHWSTHGPFESSLSRFDESHFVSSSLCHLLVSASFIVVSRLKLNVVLSSPHSRYEEKVLAVLLSRPSSLCFVRILPTSTDQHHVWVMDYGAALPCEAELRRPRQSHLRWIQTMTRKCCRDGDNVIVRRFKFMTVGQIRAHNAVDLRLESWISLPMLQHYRHCH